MFAHVHGTGKGYFAHSGSWVELANQSDLTTATTTANAALPKAGGALTGAVTTNSTFDGVDIATRDAILTSTTTTANAALPKAGGTLTGLVQSNSTIQTTANIKVGGYLLFDANDDFTGSDYYTIQDDASTDVLRIGRNFNTTDCLELNSTGDLHLKGGNLTVSGNITTSGTLNVNNSSSLSGTQVYIKKLDESTNLQRWGEGTSGASTYRFRIDQGFKFIANSGSGDKFILFSDTGNVTTDGTIDSGAITSSGSLTLSSNSTSVNTRSVLARDTNGLNIGTTNATTAISIDNSANVTMPYNLVVSGNLTVNGAQTELNVATLEVEDKNITLNYGAGDTSGSANGAGITIQDAVNSTTNATILWNAGSDQFDFSHKINVTGDFQAQNIYTQNINVLNAAGSGWHTWATRNNNKVDLNVGTISSGNITSSGTVDGVDIAARDAVLTSTTTTANAALPKAGGTMTGQLNTGHVKLTGTGTDNDSHTLYFTNGAAAIARDNNDLELHAYNAMIFGVSNTSYPTSTERMRIASNGNVGIGTDSPAHKLDIYGTDDITMRIHRPSSGLGLNDTCGIGFSQRGDTNTSTSDTRAGIFSTYNGSLHLCTEPGGNLNSNPVDHAALSIVGTDQNVGIGTTSPEKNLSIGSSQAEGIQFNFDTTNNYRNQILNYWNSSADSRMDFNVARASGATPSTIMSVGHNSNVGIGTTSPTSKLEVIVTQSDTMTDDTAAFAIKGNGGDGILMGQRATTPYAAWIAAGYLPNIGTSHNYPLTLQPHGGNVGIGTTAPGATLSIHSAVGAAPHTGDASLELRDTGARAAENGGSIIFSGVYSGTSGYLGSGPYIKAYKLNANDGDYSYGLKFATRENGTSAQVVGLTIAPDQNVGIGTASPNVKLAVDGQLSTGDKRLSLGILDLNSGTTPTQFKIITNIPFASGSADFTVNIKGFRYGTNDMVDLSIGWHYYNSTFYSSSVKSSGSYAPIVTLGVENSKVVIHLASPGYWPKLYVESLYSSAYRDSYAAGWSWADSAISSDSGTPQVSPAYSSNFGNNFLMLDNGNVGIGEASPGQKLQVNGNIRADGHYYVGGNIAISSSRKATFAASGTGVVGLEIDVDVGSSITLGNDGTYGGSGSGRYTTLGFSGTANGANKIFALNSGEDGLYICSATSRNINFRTNGGGANTFTMTSAGLFLVAGQTLIDASRNLTTGTINSGFITINGNNNAYNLKVMGGSSNSWFGVYDDANDSANILVTRSNSVDSFRHLGHTGETTIKATGTGLRIESTNDEALQLVGTGTGLNFTSGANNRIYFAGKRALEGNSAGTNLQLGENYSTVNIQAATVVHGNLTPSATNTYDLGSSNMVWRDLYIGDLNLNNETRKNDDGTTGNEIDGTTGNWTVQEGEEHLYLINNKNGKKYKFALEEIQ